jgi:hypothetical protein
MSLYRFYGYRQVRGLLTYFRNFVTLSRDSLSGFHHYLPGSTGKKIFFSGKKNSVELHVIRET